MNPPLLYVIIINWNGREHLDACFRSLQASAGENVAFLLVDNASTDGSVDFVRETFATDPRVAILALPENRGWSGGNNAGIEHARTAGADYLFLLNNDTAVEPGALEALVERMEAAPAIGALSPRMVLFDQPDILNSTGICLSLIGAAWDIGLGRIDCARWHEPEPVAGVCGGAMFLRASALDKTGLFPEDFEIYLDDLDLCLRLWNAGYTIETCPGAIVRHKFSATMGAGPRARHKYYLNTRNRFRIVLRHFPVAALPRILPRIALGEVRALGRAVLSGAFWRVPAHIRAWFAALAYLPAANRFRREHAVPANPAFWPMVRTAPLFCPAVLFPENGWYPPVLYDGLQVWPMARRASVDVPAGTLQVSLVNCYPACGDVRIALYLNDSPLGECHAPQGAETTFTVEVGTLTIVANSLFPLEETSARADAGAWLRLQCNGRPLDLTGE